MIIKDGKNRAWIVICTIVLVVATAGYVVSVRTAPNGPTGGSISGLIFGILGSLMMVFAALLGARKLVPSSRLGSAQFWLRGHIWLGLLSVPFILFHSGFGWGGLVENLLWITFGVVVLSGVFGVIVQNVLPRVMTESVPLATFVEQIPFLNRRFQAEGDCLVSQLCGRLDVDFEPIRDAAYDFAKSPGAGKLQLGKKSRRDDFEQKYLPAVYAGVAMPVKARRGAGAADDEPGDTNGDVEKSPPKLVAAGGKSVLEQARAARPALAGKTAGDKPARPDPASILAKARAARAEADAAPTEKPAGTGSILEQARSATAKKPPAAKPDPAAILAKAREAPAAKAKANDTSDADADVKKPPSAKPDTAAILAKAREAAAAKAAAAETGGTGEEKLEKRPASKPDTAAILAKAREAAAAKAAVAESAVPQPEAIAAAKSSTASILERARAAGPKEKPAGKPDPAAMLAKARAAKAATGTEPTMPSVARTTPAPAKPPVPVAAKAPKKPAPLPPHQIDEFKHFYLSAVRPFLTSHGTQASPLASSSQSRRIFEHTRDMLMEPLHAPLDRLESFCEQQRQFRVQQQLHRWLHYWLLLHVPVSMALMLLFVVHVVMAFRVVPFSL